MKSLLLLLSQSRCSLQVTISFSRSGDLNTTENNNDTPASAAGICVYYHSFTPRLKALCGGHNMTTTPMWFRTVVVLNEEEPSTNTSGLLRSPGCAGPGFRTRGHLCSLQLGGQEQNAEQIRSPRLYLNYVAGGSWEVFY